MGNVPKLGNIRTVGLGAALPASSLYYGSGCNGSSSRTCNSSGTGSQSNLTADPVGVSFTTGANAAGYTAVACGAYFVSKDATLGHSRCAIYNNTGGALVCGQSGDQAIGTVSGWGESNLPVACTLLANHMYHVYFEVDGAGTGIATNAGQGSADYIVKSYGSWPATVSPGVGTAYYSVYVKVTAN